MKKKLAMSKKSCNFAPENEREIESFFNPREYSSVGSEHLPYKQRVIGSNPITPTKTNKKRLVGFFYTQTREKC